MFVLVSQGIVIVRRAGCIDMALTDDVLLLTPGSFELTAVPVPADWTVRFEYAKIPLSVFGKFSEPSAIEQLAVGGIWNTEYNGMHICHGMLPQVARDLQILNLEMTVIESVLNTLVVSLCPAAITFLRTVYFEKRWAFLAIMELKVLQRRPVEILAARYAHGRAAFFRHCHLYTSHTPAKSFTRRRMDLADAWLHIAKRTVAEVAGDLNSGTSAFSGRHIANTFIDGRRTRKGCHPITLVGSSALLPAAVLVASASAGNRSQ